MAVIGREVPGHGFLLVDDPRASKAVEFLAPAQVDPRIWEWFTEVMAYIDKASFVVLGSMRLTACQVGFPASGCDCRRCRRKVRLGAEGNDLGGEG